MRKKAWVLLAALAVLGVAGCQTTGVPSGAETGGLTNAQVALLAEQRVYFDFDSSTISGESRAIIEAHAADMRGRGRATVALEGHCDERGTREYNLALGERRAQAVARLFRALGVSANRITTVSYGEEKPVALEHNEAAWRQNRRVEIIKR